jgi:hypothetical protein
MRILVQSAIRPHANQDSADPVPSRTGFRVGRASLPAMEAGSDADPTGNSRLHLRAMQMMRQDAHYRRQVLRQHMK